MTQYFYSLKFTPGWAASKWKVPYINHFPVEYLNILDCDWLRLCHMTEYWPMIGGESGGVALCEEIRNIQIWDHSTISF